MGWRGGAEDATPVSTADPIDSLVVVAVAEAAPFDWCQNEFTTLFWLLGVFVNMHRSPVSLHPRLGGGASPTRVSVRHSSYSRFM